MAPGCAAIQSEAITEFDACADAYEEYRPGYPAELFDFLARRFSLAREARVVDVGAGTGRASWPLADRGFRVVAVEPSAPMRARGAARAPAPGGRIQFQEGTADATHLPAASAELVICAQAFHWFDPRTALSEFARVLVPRGGLALFWNDRDLARSPIAAELEALVSRYNPAYACEYRDREWAKIIAASGWFSPAERQVFRHGVTMDADSLVGLTRSFSYIRNVLDEAGRRAFEEEVREVVRTLHGDRPFRLGYRMELFAAQRADGT